MREIKFRAWDKQTNHYWYLDIGNMVFGYSKKESDIHILRLSAMEVFNNSDRFIFEQFTGLKDKNGKEIYEGDLVKNKYGKILKVEFNSGSFTFGDYYFGSIGFGKPVEVIGNIHENADLLEVSE